MARRGPLSGVVLAAASAAAVGAPAFLEVALDAGIDHVFAPTGYPGQHGAMAGGAAVADFNADGWPDVFLPSGGSAPDALYINQGDGTFVDEAAAWGCAATHRGAGCAAGDINGDTLPDLVVLSMGDAPAPASLGDNKLYLSNPPDHLGNHSFTESAAASGLSVLSTFIDGMGAALGDYDLDGDLDLLAAHWINAARSVRLMNNDGTGRFTDATDALPTPAKNVRAFQPRFVDLNADRFPEILITGDFNSSVLYVNRGLNPDASHAGFDLRRDESAVTIDCNAMGSAVADLNADTLLDWYVTNIYSPPPVDTCGNVLYLCTSIDATKTPVFDELARPRGAHDGGWGWGTAAVDLDHDSDLDILATGGWPSWPPVPTRLFLNDGSAFFSDSADDAGIDWVGQGRALVTLDFDNDGDLDVLIVANGARARLFENVGPTAHWLRVDPVTHTHPCLAHDAFGTLVRLTLGATTLIHPLDGRSSYLSQSQQTAHFGLADSPSADRVEILWPDGSSTTLLDVPADQILTVHAYHRADFTRDGSITLDDAPPFIDAFLARSHDADLTRDSAINVDDLAAFIDAASGRPCP